jgi:large subunit ribosomal protein L6
MSRIGRKPIPVPSGVKVAFQDGHIDVQGPKGKLSFPLPPGITFEQKDGVLTATRATEEHRALHGLARALVANGPRCHAGFQEGARHRGRRLPRGA